MPPTPPDQDTPSPTDRTTQPTNDADGDDRAQPPAESLWLRVGPETTERTDGGQPLDASLADIRSELDSLDVEVTALSTDASSETRRLQEIVDRYERLLDNETRGVTDAAPGASPTDDRGQATHFLDLLKAVTDRLRR